MNRERLAVPVVILFWMSPWVPAQESKPANEAASVRQLLKRYVERYNQGDVAGLMELWSDDPEVVDDSGRSTRGRKAVEQLFKSFFEDQKGNQLSLSEKGLRFVTPDVAVIDGLVKVTATEGESETGAFNALVVRQNGQWRLARIQDVPLNTADSAAGAASQLKQLEWLVGEWESEGKNTPVTLSCQWTRNRGFLRIEQTIHLKDREPVSVTKLIGWDPLNQQIRMWLFDSNGGFGEGFWTRTGNRWTIDVAGVLSDGRQAISTNSWKYVDDTTCEWESVNRQVDGQPAPDIFIKFVKKATK
ncbi:MAG: SgcJ/EcaC family oxidoreductase [Gemmataceae bacterium]|nr:SgcJ/EcaC family oxidoreductase [Gemmataceae bacterium]